MGGEEGGESVDIRGSGYAQGKRGLGRGEK